MAKTTNQIEKNIQTSFGYVKKDLLMLNDAVSDIQTKIQHLSMNHAGLLEKIQKLEKNTDKKKTPAKKKVSKKKGKK